jgi:hypothetical protein
MHNCKATKDELVELALSRTDQNQLPPVELENCPGCREEFASLRNTLRTTEAAIDLGQPAESFWPGYHERLRERLEREPQASKGWLPPPPQFNLWLWLRRVATTSIPVPVPAVAAVFVVLVFSIFLMMHSRQSPGAGPILTPPSVITRTIEVPVIQEKLVTRIVYRKVQAPSRELIGRERVDARATDYRQSEPPLIDRGLEGFKPANDAKLTIIKGSYRDDK